MGTERTLGFVLARRVVVIGIAVGFLLDVFGRAWAVFHSGLPVTLQNIAALTSRPLHVEAFVVSLCIFFLMLTYVVGRSVEFFWLERKKTKRDQDG